MTRFELHATEASRIGRQIWYSRRALPQGRTAYARLVDLPAHILDVAAGHSTPFRGVLINRVQTRFSGSSATVSAHKVRHELQLGLLTSVYQRVGSQRFWAEHDTMFRLYPWKANLQPTAYYKAKVARWLGRGRRAPAIPRERWTATQITDEWPMELTGVVRQPVRTARPARPVEPYRRRAPRT